MHRLARGDGLRVGDAGAAALLLVAVEVLGRELDEGPEARSRDGGRSRRALRRVDLAGERGEHKDPAAGANTGWGARGSVGHVGNVDVDREGEQARARLRERGAQPSEPALRLEFVPPLKTVKTVKK